MNMKYNRHAYVAHITLTTVEKYMYTQVHVHVFN